jgi:hypothetical protein
MSRGGQVLDVNDDRVMTEFLLGGLDEQERAQIFDRLEADETYFENMTALEDDLILRWHRGTLPANQRDRFTREYADPVRRARVDAALDVLRTAEAWRQQQERLPTLSALVARVAGGFTPVQKLVGAVAGAVLIVALGVWTYLPITAPASTLSKRLTAVSEKGPGDTGFDTIELPRRTKFLELALDVMSPPAGAALSASILARDRGTTMLLTPIVSSRTEKISTVKVTIPTVDIPDGDYVLTIRAGETGSDTLATQPLRVRRRD